MEYKNDWEQSKKRLKAWWDGEVLDRICLSAAAPKAGQEGQYWDYYNFRWSLDNAPKEDAVRYWTDPETVLDRNLRKFESTWFGGESFPLIFNDLGAAGQAGYFKNAIYEFKSSIWFHPWIKDTETDPVEFDPDSLLYKKAFELSQYLVDNCCDRYFISLPDIDGCLDALAHMRGSTELMEDFYMDPEWVQESANKICDVLLDTREKLYQITKDVNEGGSCIGWLNTWSPGRHYQMQCDLSVMISPDLYREFAFPLLERQAEQMTHSLYHFDGIEQIRHLDTLLGLDTLHAIQWQSVAGQPSPVNFIPELRKIQAAGKSIILPLTYGECMKDAETLMQELSSKGLYIMLYPKDQDEAEHMLKLAEKYVHE